jgi:hypothetical protein
VRQRSSRPFAAALLAVLVLLTVTLTACGARVDVDVDVERAGRGSVTVEVQLAPGTAGAIEDLRAGLPVADLRRAGWAVVGPSAGASGTTLVSATHDFLTLSQVPVLLADIAGTGAEGSRPFRLTVAEREGALDDTFRATGTVDLRCDLSCFDDPALAARVGYPLGLPPAEISKLFGKSPAKVVTFRFRLSLPGRWTFSDRRPATGSSVLALSPGLGGATPILASTESVNVVFLRQLIGAVGAGALVVLFTATWLLRRRLRWRRSRRAEVPVTGGG